MASLKKFPEPPKGYTPPQLEELDRALQTLFPDKLGLGFAPQKSFKGRFFAWKEPSAAEKFVLDLTNQDDIKYAELVINNWQETLTTTPEYQAPTMTGAPEPEVNANIPGKAAREEQEKLRAEREAELKETQIESKRSIEAAIKRQQEIYTKEAEKLKQAEAKLEGKEVYIKVTEQTKPQLSPEEKMSVETLKNQAKANPQETAKTIENTIKERLGKSIPKSVSQKEFDIIAKQSALEITNNLYQENVAATKSAVLTTLASKSEIINGINVEGINPKDLNNWTQALYNQSLSSRNLAQIISVSAFGEKFQQAVLPTLSVEISTSTQAGYDQRFSLSEIPALYSSNILDNQQSFLDNFKEFGETEIKEQIFLRAGSFLESQIAKLAPVHPLAVIYNNKLVQASLSYFGIGPSVDWVATNGIGRIAMSMGYGDALGWLGEITGKSSFFGVAKVASAAKTAKTALTIEQTGGVMASEAFLGGAGGAAAGAVAKTGFKAIFSKITAALGTPGGPVTAFLGWLAGEVTVKIIEKIPWHKIKKLIDNFKDFFIGGAFALVGLGLGGATGAFWGGIGGFLGSKALLSTPAERAAFGGSLKALGGALAAGWLGEIGTPILATLLVFPVVVALILFIINSGAYIVPQESLSLNAGQTIISPYIDVQKVANPPGPFQNNNLPLTVQYQITIKSKKGPLINISFTSTCSVTKKNGSGSCPRETDVKAGPEGNLKNLGSFPPPAPTTITPDTSYIITYTQTYDAASFQDSFVTDTFTVSADSTEKRGAEAAASAGIKIGNPPDTCPSGWPVAGRRMITQTPGGRYSHANIEAMDIGTLPVGTPVHSTTSGTATVVYTSGPYRPVYIDISSVCAGKQIRVRYAHFSAVAIKTGQQIVLGQLLGASGTEGSGPHLHYEFIGIRMDVPYIPKSIPRGCSNDTGLCGYIP